MKKPILKTFTPISAVAAVFGLAASVANAQTTPVFNYSFPTSWSSGTAVTDTSSAGNNGTAGVSMKLDTANVPPGAPAGTDSINTTRGHIYTTGTGLLNNSAIWGAGGFTESLWFDWSGSNTTGFSGIQKLIDYAGTESLQLVTSGTTNNINSATLEMVFASDTGVESTAVSTSIVSNTWYNVTMSFAATSGNGTNDVSGIASLYVNGSLVSSGAATKGTYGDSLARPIGVGGFGYPSTTLIPFDGDIYNPNVSLGVVPEPTTLALGALGGLGMLAMGRRRKS
jgi:PEP-CTERM motif